MIKNNAAQKKTSSIKLYLHFLSINIKSQMQYKVSFFFTCLGTFFVSFTALIGMYFMMARFHKVDGFSIEEILICFSVILMSFSTAECFARGFDRFPSMLGNGQFDRIMTRPRNVILQVLGQEIQFSRMGRFVQAVIMLIYSICNCEIHWNAVKIFTLFSMIICGTAVFFGIFLIYAAICFFTTESLEILNIFTDGMREYGKYPFSIYGKEMLGLLTYCVPMALFQYYPFLYLTGRSNETLYIFLPYISLLFLIPCFLIWKIGLRHYKSTGS